MLSQLHLAGVFDQVTGMIFGQFENCIHTHEEDKKRAGTIDDVIYEWSNRLRVPCLKDFPHGHGEKKSVLPIGRMATLDVGNRSVSILAK
jgi:muramoyltetrapeptide carboxypeptidase